MKKTLAAVLVSGLAFVMVGCSSDKSSQPSLTNQLDLSGLVDATVAQVAVEGASETVQNMNPEGVPRDLLGHFPKEVPSGCDFDAASGRFVCDAVTRENGPTVNRSYAFLDAAGNSQSAYDADRTAAISFQCTVAGDFVRGNGSGSVNNQRSLTASGLAGSETSWTWNGSGSSVVHEVRTGRPGPRGAEGELADLGAGRPDSLGGPPPGGPGRGRGRGPGGGHGAPPDSLGAPDDSVTVTMDISSSSIVENVVIPWPVTETSWPLSGSITQSMTGTITGGPHDGETIQRTAVITFNGTQYATLTIGDQTQTMDLASPPEPRHHRRQGS